MLRGRSRASSLPRFVDLGLVLRLLLFALGLSVVMAVIALRIIRRSE